MPRILPISSPFRPPRRPLLLGDPFDPFARLLFDGSEYSIFCPIGVDLLERGPFSVLFSWEEPLPKVCHP